MNNRILVLAMATVFCLGSVAHANVVGGWDAARGGAGALLSGISYEDVRSDLALFYPDATLTDTNVLTNSYLNSIDVLMISPVFNQFSDGGPILSGAEQTALVNFIQNGGRALIVMDNPGYQEASNSYLNPFGLSAADSFIGDFQNANIVDSTSFPIITGGPFGDVETIQGGAIAYFEDTGSATVLATWNADNNPAAAAMYYGSGRIVFYGDENLLMNDMEDTTAFRRNTIEFLLIPEPVNVLFFLLGPILLHRGRGNRH